MSAIAKKKRQLLARSTSITYFTCEGNPSLTRVCTNPILPDQLKKYAALLDQETDAAVQFFLAFKKNLCDTFLALGIRRPRHICIIKPSERTPIGRNCVACVRCTRPRARALPVAHSRAIARAMGRVDGPSQWLSPSRWPRGV